MELFLALNQASPLKSKPSFNEKINNFSLNLYPFIDIPTPVLDPVFLVEEWNDPSEKLHPSGYSCKPGKQTIKIFYLSNTRLSVDFKIRRTVLITSLCEMRKCVITWI